MDDKRIIELFFARSDKAIDELDKKYGRVSRAIAENVLADSRDAEECVNEAYLQLWNKIPPVRPTSLSAYLLKAVRNLSVNRYHHNNAERRRGNYALCIDELSETVTASQSVDEAISERELTSYINEFLGTLDKTSRVIFVRRFWYMDSYESIAKVLGIREGAVRTRLSRTRAKLKVFLDERGVAI
jgi:RNA polymerase sigma-70 factor (ECF subfamily)